MIKLKNNLKAFWSNFGIKNYINGYDIPMGAATFHPHVFFGIIENEFQDKGYIANGLFFEQTCRRPLDELSKSNVRFSIYDQFQVIIDNNKFKSISNEYLHKIFIDSLEFIGIDIHKNEITFLESEWNSPSLGAKGIGLEVRLNNIEICQITYFTSFGGFDLKKIVLEFAYGVERIGYILYNSNINNQYLECFSKISIEQSNKLLEIYNEAIKDNIKEKLYISAYDYFLMGNNILNIMDANCLIDNTTKNVKLIELREFSFLIAKTYKNYALS